jgi:ABC-2 type transport system permease protein
MSTLVVHQARYELLAFWRNTQGRFVTLALPIVFLVLFTSVFGDGHIEVDGRDVRQATYYVGYVAALGVVSAAFTSLVIMVTIDRESGILKRRRAAPVSGTGLIAGRVASAAVIAIAAVACLLVVARIAYDVKPEPVKLPAVVLATVVGAASFACLGYAVASFIRSADAANPVTQCILLPLYFISGVFVPSDEIPSGLLSVADVLPVRPLAQALYAPFDPATTGAAIAGGDLLVVALWGVAGIVIATLHFSWAPRG